MDVASAAQRSWGGGRVADGCSLSCTEKLGGGRVADGCSLSCTEKLGGGAGWPMGVALAAQRSWGGGQGGRWV